MNETQAADILQELYGDDYHPEEYAEDGTNFEEAIVSEENSDIEDVLRKLQDDINGTQSDEKE